MPRFLESDENSKTRFSRLPGINAKLCSRTSVGVSPETPLDYNPTEFRADRSKDGRIITEIPTASGAESRLLPW